MDRMANVVGVDGDGGCGDGIQTFRSSKANTPLWPGGAMTTRSLDKLAEHDSDMLAKATLISDWQTSKANSKVLTGFTACRSSIES